MWWVWKYDQNILGTWGFVSAQEVLRVRTDTRSTQNNARPGVVPTCLKTQGSVCNPMSRSSVPMLYNVTGQQSDIKSHVPYHDRQLVPMSCSWSDGKRQNCSRKNNIKTSGGVGREEWRSQWWNDESVVGPEVKLQTTTTTDIADTVTQWSVTTD